MSIEIIQNSPNSLMYSTETQIEASIQSLHKAQSKFSQLEVKQRQIIIKVVGLRLQKKKDIFAQLITQEMRKPIKESQSEVEKCLKSIEIATSSDLSFFEPEVVSSSYAKSVVTHVALGVVYAIMPWNFPLWQVIRMCIPTLLAGNAILLKHSDLTPRLALLIHELFKEVYDQPILVVHYISHQMTDFILKNSFIAGVSLTGSVEAGRSVYQSAALHLKKAVLELGGSDPYIVLADADLILASKKIASGRLLNCGQTCISVKRVLVHESLIDSLIALLKAEFETYKFGEPEDPQTSLGPLAHIKFKESLKKQIESMLQNTDAKLIYSKPHGQNENLAFVDAEIYLITENLAWLNNQEFFAPVLLITPFKTEEEAISLANSTNFALGAGIFTQDANGAQLLARQIVAGQIVVNGLVASDMSLPFGGFKCSGIGRELGRAGYLEWTQTKVISSS